MNIYATIFGLNKQAADVGQNPISQAVQTVPPAQYKTQDADTYSANADYANKQVQDLANKYPAPVAQSVANAVNSAAQKYNQLPEASRKLLGDAAVGVGNFLHSLRTNPGATGVHLGTAAGEAAAAARATGNKILEGAGDFVNDVKAGYNSSQGNQGGAGRGSTKEPVIHIG